MNATHRDAPWWRRTALAGALAAMLGGALVIAHPSPAEAAVCQSGNPAVCDWTGYKQLHFAYGAISYGDTIAYCNFSYAIYLGQNKARSTGDASCDQSNVRIYYGTAPGWVGWSSWAWGEYSAIKTVTGSAVRSEHRVDAWE